MPKKILVLTASPRKKGNSNTLAQAFIEACKNINHEVKRFDAPFLKLTGCRACGKCFSKDKACVFDDDFNNIATEIEAADVIVFATPVYWYTLPSQIKMIIDRLYSFLMGGKDLSQKQYALLTCCEDKDDATFTGVRFAIQKTAELFKWQALGEVCVPGVTNVGDIQATDGCQRAAALADSI